jgi:AcrR family transcriptional regulator
MLATLTLTREIWGGSPLTGSKSVVKAKKNYHHGDLKEQLLEAVRELVEVHGPDGFSIAEACRRAGVSTAAPYKHFRDRPDILRHAVLQAMRRLHVAMKDAIDAHPIGDPRRVVALGAAYIDFARSEQGMFRTMFGLAGDHAEDAELEAAGEAATVLVERVVADHLDLPRDAPEVRLRAYALWCFVHGHSFLQIDGKLAHGLDQLDEQALLHLVGDGILPQERG